MRLAVGLLIGFLLGALLFRFDQKATYENGWETGYAYKSRTPWNAKRDYLNGVKMGWWLHMHKDSLSDETLDQYRVGEDGEE